MVFKAQRTMLLSNLDLFYISPFAMTSAPANKTSWNFHAERDALIAEAHARPAQSVRAPAEILHVAFAANQEVYQQFFDKIDPDASPSSLRHIVGALGKIRVKMERHTEFMSCTLFKDLNDNADDIRLPDFLRETFPMEDTEIHVLVRLKIVKSAREMLKELPIDERIYGGKIRNDIDVRSTFKPDASGAIRFVLYGKNLTGDELGRRLQRLIEMETYRTMSLLGLPKARNVSAQLTGFERELDDLTVSLRDNDASQLDDEDLFQRLSGLSERNNILASEIRYRFAASRAYFDLFTQRMSSLEEVKVGDVQTMSGFLRSRINPAIATIESTAKRQETLTNDLSRALVLLRTRIELNLNKGNQALLQSMDKRHDQQLKISRTVEGLSVVAITYYAVGLVSHLLKAISEQPWMPLSNTTLTALSVPFILALVWFALHRVRSAWSK